MHKSPVHAQASCTRTRFLCMHGPEHMELAVTLGQAHGKLGDAFKAKQLLERALAIQEREYGPEHRELVGTLANLGNSHGELGDASKQKQLLERALAIQEREYGPEHRELVGKMGGKCVGNLLYVLIKGEVKQQKYFFIVLRYNILHIIMLLLENECKHIANL